MSIAQHKDKEKRREYNREYYDRQAANPVFRAKQVARQKDYAANRAPRETIENAQRLKKLHGQRRQIWRRALALDHYGGECACCGEDRAFFLVIDHIDGGGNKHRKETGMWRLADWLRKNDWPSGFQVLCHNCNAAKYKFGECPCGEEIPR